jgi:ribosomal protein S12 methylthiotransferase
MRKKAIVVINTPCGFNLMSKREESVNTHSRFCRTVLRGEVDQVFASGCLSERYKPDLQKENSRCGPAVFWNYRIACALLKALGADYKHELIGERTNATPKVMPISRLSKVVIVLLFFLCDSLMRGGHKSTPIENLIIEAVCLAAKGVKELFFIPRRITGWIYTKTSPCRSLRELYKWKVTRDTYALRLSYWLPVDVLDVMNEEPIL